MPTLSKSVAKELLSAPIRLAPNTYLHFYNGGKLRAEFMGEDNPKDDYYSEEWIFSTNRAITPSRENPPDKGLSRIELPSGEKALLKELLDLYPEQTLGSKHVDKFGTNLGVLFKIFDVGEGAHIPIHWHPTPQFALKHLNSPFGKNEAWIIIGTRPGAKAWIGWKESIDPKDFQQLMNNQDIETLRGLMHEVEPEVGEVYYVETPIVHSLGTGLCVLEPQEPTDWNILAEWEAFPFDKEDGNLGLGWDLAISAADFSKMELSYLNNYIKRAPKLIREEKGGRQDQLVPNETSKYFQVSRLTIDGTFEMESGQGFYCLTTLGGEGKLIGDFDEIEIKRGKSVFVPSCIENYQIICVGNTPLEIICCYPPCT